MILRFHWSNHNLTATVTSCPHNLVRQVANEMYFPNSSSVISGVCVGNELWPTISLIGLLESV